MTTNARLLPAGDEVVRLVTTEARVVARGAGTCRRLVARSALRLREDTGLVRAMAIEAALRSGVVRVLGCELRVARGAILWLDRRVFVELVALRAFDVGVNRDRVRLAVCLRVARDAARRFFWRERVTRQAIRLGVAAGVEMRFFFFVTVRARRRARALEANALVVVTLLAFDAALVDVRAMTGARLELLPLRRNRKTDLIIFKIYF